MLSWQEPLPLVSFQIASDPAVLRLLGQRAHSAPDGGARETFAYRAEGQPLLVWVERTRSPRGVNTVQARLFAERNVAGPIQKVHILDARWPLASPRSFVAVRGWNGGGINNQTAHVPSWTLKMWDQELREGQSLRRHDHIGRGSTENLPIWFLYTETRGLWFGPEWSGTWELQIACAGDRLDVRLGLPFLSFAMYQGEEIMLPAVSFGDYDGDIDEGCRALRRTICEEFLPTIDGRKPDPPVCYHVIGGRFQHFSGDGVYQEIDRAADLGAESMVLASCWLEPPRAISVHGGKPEHLMRFVNGVTGEDDVGNWHELVGNYFPQPDRFPEGFGPVVKYMKDRGMKLGLWIDPRVSWWSQAYAGARDIVVEPKPDVRGDLGFMSNPEWLESPVNLLPLMDTGRMAGEEYLFETIHRMIVEYGAQWIYYDLNTEIRPLFWNAHEEENRKGLAELRHLRGLDRVFDRILREHPGVWIEFCSSGGRMLSLGTLRRAHSLWISDYCDCSISQGEHWNTDVSRGCRSSLNHILPSVYLQNSVYVPRQASRSERPFGLHNFLSQFGGVFSLGPSPRDWKQKDIDDAKAAIALFKQVRRYFHKDYAELFPLPTRQDAWDGWQFHDLQTGTGIVCLFKLLECGQEAASVTLKWVDGPLRVEILAGEAKVSSDGPTLSAEMGKSRAVLLRYELGRCQERT